MSVPWIAPFLGNRNMVTKSLVEILLAKYFPFSHEGGSIGLMINRVLVLLFWGHTSIIAATAILRREMFLRGFGE